MSKGSWIRKGFKFGTRVDANLDGKDTFKSGFDLIDIWPKHCTQREKYNCLQCFAVVGKVRCAPRFREKVIVMTEAY